MTLATRLRATTKQGFTLMPHVVCFVGCSLGRSGR
jgi:hypothetical protein